MSKIICFCGNFIIQILKFPWEHCSKVSKVTVAKCNTSFYKNSTETDIFHTKNTNFKNEKNLLISISETFCKNKFFSIGIRKKIAQMSALWY